MRIGIVGCGQLARLLALAGWNMGLKFSFLADPDESASCVEGLGTIARRGPGDDPATLYRSLGEPDVITVEREHVDAALLRELAAFCPVYPDPEVVHTCQDKPRPDLDP